MLGGTASSKTLILRPSSLVPKPYKYKLTLTSNYLIYKYTVPKIH